MWDKAPTGPLTGLRVLEITAAILCLPLLAAAPAAAQPTLDTPLTLPPGATAMIETAVRSNDETEIRTVVRVAKATWPDSAAAIDAFVEAARKEEQAARYQRIEEGNILTEWHGEIRLGGSTATGNSGRTTTTVGVEAGRDGPDWRHAAELELYYSFSGDDDPTKRINAFWQSDYKLSTNRFLYGRLSYLKNFSAGIRDRVVESAGYGARFERGERLDGHVTAGAAARQARYYDGDFRTDVAVRVGSRVNWDIWKGVRLSNVNTFYITDDATIDNTVSLRASIVQGLSVIFSFNLQWEDAPAVGFEPLSTLTSITIGFGF
jgi:putative salt-induced outer membrane protein YdiY